MPPRDIDVTIAALVVAHPGMQVEQLRVTHPGDDDGLWFFVHPAGRGQVQVESSTGTLPFLIEGDFNPPATATTVEQAIRLVAALLGLSTAGASAETSLDVAIARRIGEFLVDSDARLGWVRSAVREHGFLPVHVGWLGVIGVRTDGSFVVWWHDDDPPHVDVALALEARTGAVQAARMYPELAPLVPLRPEAALDCVNCIAAGEGSAGHLICSCGGVGWTVPGEAQGRATG